MKWESFHSTFDNCNIVGLICVFRFQSTSCLLASAYDIRRHNVYSRVLEKHTYDSISYWSRDKPELPPDLETARALLTANLSWDPLLLMLSQTHLKLKIFRLGPNRSFGNNWIIVIEYVCKDIVERQQFYRKRTYILRICISLSLLRDPRNDRTKKQCPASLLH